jgi:tetratricopeptide (TPR) repeat protein
MEFLSLDYRDPLYGILILFAIVLIIKFTDFWAKFFTRRESIHSISKYIRNFEGSKTFNEYKDLIKSKNLPTESIVLMALNYDKSGEYNKSIDIYSTLLNSVVKDDEKRYILTLLAKTYYKAGFLYKSRDIFLSALKLYPKNEEALTYLVSIYESLKEYDNAIEVVNTLETISEENSGKRLYFQILTILNRDDLSYSLKMQRVISLGIDQKIVQRKLFEFAILHNLKLPNDILKKFNFANIIDLIWEMDKRFCDDEFIQNNKLLSDIYSIKEDLPLFKSKNSDNFELNILIKLKQVEDFSADLAFTYGCVKCKNIFPLYFYRCPVCKNIDCATIETNLVRREYETGSFV